MDVENVTNVTTSQRVHNTLTDNDLQRRRVAGKEYQIGSASSQLHAVVTNTLAARLAVEDLGGIRAYYPHNRYNRLIPILATTYRGPRIRYTLSLPNCEP